MIENHIGVFENVLSEKECTDMINFFETNAKLGKTFNRREIDPRFSASTQKKDSTLFVDFSLPSDMFFTVYPNIESIIEKLGRCYREYANKFDVLDTVAKHQLTPVIRVQKTEVGGGYHLWHCEKSEKEFSNRLLVITAYLNDVVEGGETEFLYQHKRIPSKMGSVCIFPSAFTHTHRGNPPLSNTKYIMTSWIEYIA
jgi:hypothetical protein